MKTHTFLQSAGTSYLPTIGLFLAANLSSAQAFLLSAEAQYYESGSLRSSDDQSTDTGLSVGAGAAGSYGSASSYVSLDGILNVSARTTNVAASRQPMSLANIPSDPGGAYSSQAISRWEDTVTNNTGQQIDYRYIFHVSNPRLSTGEDPLGYAALSLNITLDGVSIWSAFATLDGTNLDFSESMSALGASGSNYAHFASFDASASLGTFASGNSFTIAYELIAYAESSDSLFHVYAAVGDPARPEGSPLEVIATVVPEPSTGILLLSVMGLVTLRRR